MTLLLMIFLHIVDDFYLQPGMLSKLKCRSFWEENAPDKKYEYDYVVALLIHSFSWSFMMMLPIFFLEGFILNPILICLFFINLFLHFYIDNEKANEYTINLVVDQLIHLVQIIVTFLIYNRTLWLYE